MYISLFGFNGRHLNLPRRDWPDFCLVLLYHRILRIFVAICFLIHLIILTTFLNPLDLLYVLGFSTCRPYYVASSVEARHGQKHWGANQVEVAMPRPYSIIRFSKQLLHLSIRQLQKILQSFHSREKKRSGFQKPGPLHNWMIWRGWFYNFRWSVNFLNLG